MTLAVEGEDFDPAPEDGAFAALQETLQAALVRLPEPGRYDGRREGPADRFPGLPAEHDLRLRVPGLDASVGCHDHHGVERRVEDGLELSMGERSRPGGCL